MKKIALFTFLIIFGAFSFGQTKNVNSYFELIRPLYTGELAYETVDFVEDYWRVAGNTGFNKTVYKIAEKLETAGYVLEEKASENERMTYRIEKRAMKNETWEPVNASLKIIGQDTALLKYPVNRNMIYLNSVSTPEEGVRAEVIYVQKVEDIKTLNLKGKIIFTELSPWKLFEEFFIEKGAIGIITYNNPGYLQPEKNKTSIQFRSLPYHKKTEAWGIALSFAAKETLKKSLKKGKVEVQVNIRTKRYPSEELTIIADIKGGVIPKERLVFSAHIQEPGANDNASGVGAQLEMAVLTANLMNNQKIDLDRTLTYLWGDEIISTHRYITENSNRASNIKWGISLDMVGENTAITGGTFLIEKMPDPSAIWTRGSDKHSEWGGKVMKRREMKPHYLNDFILTNFKIQGKYANWEVNTNPFEGGSDHIPFLKANIPGLLLWHFTDQFYHTDNDRLDKVSKETLKNVGTSALASALVLLNSNKETAIDQLVIIESAAQKRMSEEFKLSLENIKKGNKVKEEIKILKAWEAWYISAMKTVNDMDYSGSSKLHRAVEIAQSSLKKSVKNHKKNLKKASR